MGCAGYCAVRLPGGRLAGSPSHVSSEVDWGRRLRAKARGPKSGWGGTILYGTIAHGRISHTKWALYIGPLHGPQGDLGVCDARWAANWRTFPGQLANPAAPACRRQSVNWRTLPWALASPAPHVQAGRGAWNGYRSLEGCIYTRAYYTCTYVYTSIYTYIHTYIHIYIYISPHTPVDVYIYIHVRNTKW